MALQMKKKLKQNIGAIEKCLLIRKVTSNIASLCNLLKAERRVSSEFPILNAVLSLKYACYRQYCLSASIVPILWALRF